MTFEQYATRQLRTLLGTAQAICSDLSLAEDLVQDVLIKVHARWDVIEGLERRDAYVRRMLVNEFVSWRRKWSRVSPHPDAVGMADAVSTSVAASDYADDHAQRWALLDDVRRLPRQQRLVVAMRYFADLSDAEIAATLECTESTVRVHASRALAALRVRLSAEAASPLPTQKNG